MEQRGSMVYKTECARCHGVDLAGEEGWQDVHADGRVRAPPHDKTGHTWMHTRAELFHLVKFGMGSAAVPGYVSDMPVFGGRLRDADIKAVLAYIAGRWPPGYRAYQIMLEPGFDPALLPKGEWTLPLDCKRNLDLVQGPVKE